MTGWLLSPTTALSRVPAGSGTDRSPSIAGRGASRPWRRQWLRSSRSPGRPCLRVGGMPGRSSPAPPTGFLHRPGNMGIHRQWHGRRYVPAFQMPIHGKLLPLISGVSARSGSHFRDRRPRHIIRLDLELPSSSPRRRAQGRRQWGCDAPVWVPVKQFAGPTSRCTGHMPRRR